MLDRGENFPVDDLWNPSNFTVYLFDDGQTCLEAGSTELFVRNDPANPDNPGGVVFDQTAAILWSAGRLLLLRDRPADPSESDRLHVVRSWTYGFEPYDLSPGRGAPPLGGGNDPFAIPFDELQHPATCPATAGESARALFRSGRSANDINAIHTALVGEIYSAGNAKAPYSEAGAGLVRGGTSAGIEDETASRAPIYLLSLPGTVESGWRSPNGAATAPHEPETLVLEIDHTGAS